jgi:pseudouridylate synthase I
LPTYRLTIEFEGTRYSGWQVQGNTPKTVQGKISRSALELFGEADLMGAGRTDAGVHAAAQVAHLRIRNRIAPHELQIRLNDSLPHDIHVLRVENVPDRFHARHDAVARIYLYQIATRRTAFGKPYVWWIRDPLDVEAIREAASSFVGMHDFAAFADKRATTESTLVAVEAIDVGTSEELILIRISASHFLWKMVRKLVAALAEVGRGNLTPQNLASRLEPGGERFTPTAPPSGLFLEAVLYEGEVFDRSLEPIVPVRTVLPVRPTSRR